MAKAIWNGKVLAESDRTIEIEGNQYFPPDSINREFFLESSETSSCPWKGKANYYTITVEGDKNENAAWYYADPKDAAKEIRNYVAFWNGVEVEV